MLWRLPKDGVPSIKIKIWFVSITVVFIRFWGFVTLNIYVEIPFYFNIFNKFQNSAIYFYSCPYSSYFKRCYIFRLREHFNIYQILQLWWFFLQRNNLLLLFLIIKSKNVHGLKHLRYSSKHFQYCIFTYYPLLIIYTFDGLRKKVYEFSKFFFSLPLTKICGVLCTEKGKTSHCSHIPIQRTEVC